MVGKCGKTADTGNAHPRTTCVQVAASENSGVIRPERSRRSVAGKKFVAVGGNDQGKLRMNLPCEQNQTHGLIGLVGQFEQGQARTTR